MIQGIWQVTMLEELETVFRKSQQLLHMERESELNCLEYFEDKLSYFPFHSSKCRSSLGVDVF